MQHLATTYTTLNYTIQKKLTGHCQKLKKVLRHFHHILLKRPSVSISEATKLKLSKLRTCNTVKHATKTQKQNHETEPCFEVT